MRSKVITLNLRQKNSPPAKLTKDTGGLRQHIGRINLVQTYKLNL